MDKTLHRDSKTGPGQSQPSNQNTSDMGNFIPGQLPLFSVKEEPLETVGGGTNFTTQLSVKEEPLETVGSGTNITTGHPAIVDPAAVAQSAEHVQTDHSDPTLQIEEHAQEASVIPAPSGNREFWKCNIDIPSSSARDEELAEDIVRVSSSYLHANATSHQWALGAVAELLDNAMDERENGATLVAIDKMTNPRDKAPALLIQDNGGGMDPDGLRRCVSFGCSSKKKTHGKYGNGFKTGTMRLGADVVVFTASNKNGVATQSVGVVSTTFLRETGSAEYIFPVVDYEILEGQPRRLFREKEDWGNKISAILEWSPYSTEEELLKQFDDVKPHGTKIIIYNLWCLEDGQTELDFDSDKEDILLRGISKINEKNAKELLANHIATRLRYSLRAYSSILYRRMPSKFKIILRGKEVQHHSIVDELKFTEVDTYKPKPEVSGTEILPIFTTIGFTKEAPLLNVHGFNVYHKNRLILPFHKVFEESSSRGRGVVGVLEVDCIEPTHNKQDFERTHAFSKIENRMRHMTLDYWKRKSVNVGYAAPTQARRKPRSVEEAPTNNNNNTGFQEHVPQPDQLGSSALMVNTAGTGIQLVSPIYSTSGTEQVSTTAAQRDQGISFNQHEQHISSVDIDAQRISDQVEPDLSRISYQGPSQSATALSPNIPLHSAASNQAPPVLSYPPGSEGSGPVSQVSKRQPKKKKISQPSSSAPLTPMGPPAPVIPNTASAPSTSNQAPERPIDPTAQVQSSSERHEIQELREENRKLRAEIADSKEREKAIRLKIKESETEIQQLQRTYEEFSWHN